MAVRTYTSFPDDAVIMSVMQGDFAVSNRREVVFSTLLGSCVAVCMYDSLAEVGGMNHYLLPAGRAGDAHEKKFGSHSMELLINGLLRRGAMRNRLKAKIYGGANVTVNTSGIGQRNISFAKEFLKGEGFLIEDELIGGNRAIRTHFHGASGFSKAVRISDSSEVANLSAMEDKKPISPSVGDVTLF